MSTGTLSSPDCTGAAVTSASPRNTRSPQHTVSRKRNRPASPGPSANTSGRTVLAASGGDDGLDNNGNGAVDEGCGCALGTTRRCWAGPPEARGVGACTDGEQPCQGSGEFAHWGECTGQTLPAADDACDGIDNDCDYAVDEWCDGACTPSEFAAETICDDGLDNECDELADCHDPDCPPCCTAEVCGDGIDNDCDTVPDEGCGGPCLPNEFAGWGTHCRDGEDDDCDTRTDCDDIDCLIICCADPEACGDGADNDCDRRVDCDDPDCCTDSRCAGIAMCDSVCCIPGSVRWCDTPSYCSWGRQTCQPDGGWGMCEETTDRPPGCEGYYYRTECCVSSGACCQNYGTYDSSLPPEASIGNCSGTVGPC